MTNGETEAVYKKLDHVFPTVFPQLRPIEDINNIELTKINVLLMAKSSYLVS